MKIFLDCIPCFIRQALDAARMTTDDELIHEQIVRETVAMIESLDLHQSPPAIGQRIHRRVRELAETADPYRAMKQKHNQLALELYDLLAPSVRSSDYPLETAVRLAIAGNIIDLGVKTTISDTDIQRTIDQSLTAPLETALVDALAADAAKAERILYLADNAGEIVFDRLLIEQLPTPKITVAVKGYPIINDATLEDAEQAGVTKLVPVIDNGSDAPGTILSDCSPEFREIFDSADLVIAKGQGNYETLSDVSKNIFFILKAKCPVIAADLGCRTGDMILRRRNPFPQTVT